MNKEKKKLVGIAVVFLAVILFCSQTVLETLNCTMTNATVTHSPKSMNRFELMWSLDDIYIRDSKAAVYLIAGSKKLVMYGRDNRCGYDKLVNFSANDGEYKIHSNHAIPSNTGVHHTAYDSNYAYWGYDGNRSNLSSIVAYEIDRDTISWIQHPSVGRSSQIGYLLTDGTTVNADTTVLNASNGEIIRERDRNVESEPLHSSGNPAFWYATVNLQDNSDSLEFWNNLSLSMYQPPLLLENTIINRTHRGDALGKIEIFNRKTYELLWDTPENVISNVSTNGSTIFFLTSSAKLLAVDIETGQEIGLIQFTNERFQLGETRGFFVAANEGSVFVYLGDSRQILAFRLLSDE